MVMIKNRHLHGSSNIEFENINSKGRQNWLIIPASIPIDLKFCKVTISSQLFYL